MELPAIPILAPPSAPAEGATVGAAAPAPEGAFAELLGTAMIAVAAPTISAPSVLEVNPPEAALPVETLPTPMPLATASPTMGLPVASSVSLKATVSPDAGAPSTPTPPSPGRSPEVSTGDSPPATDVAATEAPEAIRGPKSTTRPSKPRSGVWVQAPPDPPPPLPKAVSLEKEAPTTAPTAPVTPLDRSSKESPLNAPESAIVPTVSVPATQAVPALKTIFASIAPLNARPSDAPFKATAPVALPRPEALGNMAEPHVEGAVEPGEDGTAKIASSDPAPSIPSLPVDVRTAASPDVALEPTPASKLESAPDLGIVPQVVTTPVPIAALDSSATPVATNPKIARVAERATFGAAAPETKANTTTPGSKGTTPVATELSPTGVVLDKEGDASAGGDTQGDAPKDPTPQSAPALVARTDATERPEGGTNRPAIDRGIVVRQVADRIESLVAARPKDGVTVHLEPRDLGTVTLVVKGLAHALDVQVSASDDRVRGALSESRSELAQALAPRGLGIRELRVAAPTTGSSAATGGNPNPSPNPNSEGRARPHSPASFFAKASRTEAAETKRPSRTSGRGVDLLV